MKRNDLQNNLKKLGFTRLCDDHKTLCAYNQVQFFLKSNRTPLKDITKVYLNKYNELRIVLNDEVDIEAGYNLDNEIL